MLVYFIDHLQQNILKERVITKLNRYKLHKTTVCNPVLRLLADKSLVGIVKINHKTIKSTHCRSVYKWKNETNSGIPILKQLGGQKRSSKINISTLKY